MNNRPLCLLVDDEADVLTVTISTLEAINIACLTASNIQTAKQLLHTHTFDVCLADVVLPDGNGILELARYIKIHYPNLPVIIFSATGSKDDRERARKEAMKVGAYGFVAKPIDNNELRALIKKALHIEN